MDRVSAWQLATERFAMEIVLAICCLYSAVALYSTPHRTQWTVAYALPPWIPGTAREWAVVMGIAGACETIGLIMCTRRPMAGFLPRVVGLALSGLIWTSLGLGRLMETPYSLFALPVVFFGLGAWWVLLRSPSIRQQ